MSLRQGDKVIAGNVSHYNTGDTFMTKRTDTNVAGAVECDGATYNTTDFTGDGSIGELLEAGKLDYVSLSAYSTAIAQTGWCDKIGWDGAGNTQFRVPTINPRHYIIKTQEPTAENNYTWYKLYADGWVEQGSDTSNSGQTVTVNMPVEMADTRYTVILTLNHDNTNAIYPRTVATKSTTSFVSKSYNDRPFNWVVSGMSNITPESASRVMIQLFNSTTDEAVATVGGVLADVAALKGYDYVVEFQAPTAENGYTWYRKYKSGWVEQGGRVTNVNYDTAVSLPVEMADAYYSVSITPLTPVGNAGAYMTGLKTGSQTTTGFNIAGIAAAANNNSNLWQVSGMAAQ